MDNLSLNTYCLSAKIQLIKHFKQLYNKICKVLSIKEIESVKVNLKEKRKRPR